VLGDPRLIDRASRDICVVSEVANGDVRETARESQVGGCDRGRANGDS
jgi:hypothetical protein